MQIKAFVNTLPNSRQRRQMPEASARMSPRKQHPSAGEP